MSRTIYKYPLKPFGVARMPLGAEVLSVGAQGDAIVAWAIVDNRGTETEPRAIIGFPTGGDAPPEGAHFVGTVQRYDGLVFHFFDFGKMPSPPPNPTACGESSE